MSRQVGRQTLRRAVALSLIVVLELTPGGARAGTDDQGGALMSITDLAALGDPTADLWTLGTAGESLALHRFDGATGVHRGSAAVSLPLEGCRGQRALEPSATGIWTVDYFEFPYPAAGGLGLTADRTSASCNAWIPFDGSDPTTSRVRSTANAFFQITSAFSSGDDLVQTTSRFTARDPYRPSKALMQSVTPGEEPRDLIKRDARYSTATADGEAWALTSRYNPRTGSSANNAARVDLETGKTSPERLPNFSPVSLTGGDGHVAVMGARSRTKPVVLVLDSATGEVQGTLDRLQGFSLPFVTFGSPFLTRVAGDSVLMQSDGSGTVATGLYRAPVADHMQLELVEECDCWFAPLGRVPGGIWFARVPRDMTGGQPVVSMVRYDSATGTLGPEVEQDPLDPVTSGAAPGPEPEALPGPPEGATFTSTSFADGGAIPARYTCQGEDVSPDLSWSGAEDGVEEYAVVVTDLDANGFVHWVVTGISGLSSLPEDAGDPEGIGFWTQGANDLGGLGWSGPCPNDAHRYRFTLYRSPTPLGLAEGATAAEVHAAVAAAGGTAQQFSGTYTPGA